LKFVLSVGKADGHEDVLRTIIAASVISEGDDSTLLLAAVNEIR
jgi:hypothetical protein